MPVICKQQAEGGAVSANTVLFAQLKRARPYASSINKEEDLSPTANKRFMTAPATSLIIVALTPRERGYLPPFLT